MKITYKNHPVFTELKISSDGNIVKQNNIKLDIRKVYPKPNNPLMVVYLYDTYFSLPKLVLETYVGYPDSEKRHFAYCKDGNIENTNPDNLKWVTSLNGVTPERKFAHSTRLSKLTEKQTYECFVRKSKGESLKKIAQDFGVSDMSIHRAIKRINNL